MNTSGRPTRSTRAETTALAGAGVYSGLVAYAFVVIGVRVFGTEAFAPIAVVWSLWAIAAAAISTPLQHWTIQTLQVTGGEAAVRARRGRLVATALSGAVVLTAVAVLQRTRLYGVPDIIYPIVSGTVVATAALAGYVRGVLGGRNRFPALAATLVAEGTLRLVLLAVVASVGLEVVGAAATIPAATIVVVGWASTFRLAPACDTDAAAPPGLGALTAAFVLVHVTLNAPPVIASALGADPAVVSSLFAAFALFRAPFLVMSTVATRISYWLAQTAATGQAQALDRFRTVVIALAGIGAVLSWALGRAPVDAVLRLVYGPDVSLRAAEGPSIVAGSVVSVGGLLLVLLLAARGRAGRTLGPLVAGMVAGGSWAVLGPGAVGARVAGGFLLSQVVHVAALWVTDHRVAGAARAVGREAPVEAP